MNLARLDPRIKLFLLVGLSTSAIVTRMLTPLLSLLALALILLLAGGIRPSIMWVRLRGLFGLIVMLFLLQCLFNRRGSALLATSGITLITDLGFQTALFICLRLLIVILSALIVTTGEPRDYLLAFTYLKVPYEISFMVLTSLRFLPMLREEARDVLCAAQMRGLRVKKAGLRHQAGAYISILLPVVAGAIHRSEQLSIAMEARGFRAYPRRTSMRQLRMRFTDWAYLLLFCAVIVTIFIINKQMQ